jgi:hypothetical protein
MIRLSWLQFRMQAAVVAGALVLLALALALTGPHLAHLYDTSGISACQAQADCASLSSRFLSQAHAGFIDKLLLGFGNVVLAAPALVGIFWGAPLIARELEAGTYRLAWTQTVTRRRWVAVKIGVVGLASVAAVGLLSLMLTWWFRSVDLVNMNLLTPAAFSERGIAPVGYAAFAFALGLAVGVLVRRTLPAMAVTVAVFAGTRLAIALWVRPHLIAPVHATAKEVEGLANGALRLWPAVGPHGPVGVPVTIPPSAWIYSNNMHGLVIYQPANRFWAFQWAETSIFLALALLLAGLCFWLIRRRLS